MLFGGDGYDTVSYYHSYGAVSVNLANMNLNAGDAAGHVYFGIEAFSLSNFDDTFVGSNLADFVNGNFGNDTLFGNDGADILDGGAGNDWLDGGDGDDVLHGGTRFVPATPAAAATMFCSAATAPTHSMAATEPTFSTAAPVPTFSTAAPAPTSCRAAMVTTSRPTTTLPPASASISLARR